MTTVCCEEKPYNTNVCDKALHPGSALIRYHKYSLYRKSHKCNICGQTYPKVKPCGTSPNPSREQPYKCSKYSQLYKKGFTPL